MALHAAAKQIALGLLKQLLTDGKSVNEPDVAIGNTPLHYAAKRGESIRLVYTLIFKNGP